MKVVNIQSVKNLILVILMQCIVMDLAYAAKPMWTFRPITPTTVALPPGTKDFIQFEVTNQLSRSKSLVLAKASGINQGESCHLPK